MNDQSAAEHALRAVVGPAHNQLVVQLSNCAGAAAVAAENRVLRIVGVQLAQRGLGDLFEQIYCTVLEGAEPGDGRQWLRAELRER